ncbi:MAG TPA: hypothetical protein VM888_06005, partial [Chitinophagaceae bacterium]|nr:hypothetical protein [Chitinophagaceae bacterium]
MLANRKNSILLIIVFVCTLLIRYQQYYIYREFNSDKARQLHGSYNLLKNKGISIESYDLNTFKPLYRYVSDWPPAYSYFTAGISFVSGVDLYLASIILDLLSTTALWFILVWIMGLLQFTFVQQLLLLLFLSISKTVLTQFLSADLFGLTLFLLSSALCIKYVQQRERNRKHDLIFYGFQLLIFIVLVFLKFSLIPAAAAPALSILLYAFVTSNKSYIKPGIILFLLFIISMSLLFLYKEGISGDSVTYQRVMTSSVLHYDNLLLFNPFVASTFFYLAPLYLRFNNDLLNVVAIVITLLTLIVFLIYFFNNIQQKLVDYLDILLLTTLITVSGF